MSSRPSSRFFSRAPVGDATDYLYNLLTATGQTLNPIKSAGAAQPTDNEAAVRDFQAAVRKLPTLLP